MSSFFFFFFSFLLSLTRVFSFLFQFCVLNTFSLSLLSLSMEMCLTSGLVTFLLLFSCTVSSALIVWVKQKNLPVDRVTSQRPWRRGSEDERVIGKAQETLSASSTCFFFPVSSLSPSRWTAQIESLTNPLSFSLLLFLSRFVIAAGMAEATRNTSNSNSSSNEKKRSDCTGDTRSLQCPLYLGLDLSTQQVRESALNYHNTHTTCALDFFLFLE